MVQYYLLLLLPALLSLMRIKGKLSLKKKQNIVIFFFLLLFLLLCLRMDTVGTDLQNYSARFYLWKSLSFSEMLSFGSEPAFYLLNWVIGRFTDNFQVVVAVVAFITVFPIMYTYKSEVETPVSTIVLFMTGSNFVLLFSGLRQAIAVSIGMIAFEFTRKKKLIPFLIAVGIAFLFHNSAFILLLMYPAFHLKNSRRIGILLVPAFVILFLSNSRIFALLAPFFSERFSADVIENGAYSMIILYALFAVFSYLLPDENLIDDETIGLRNFLLISLFLQIFAPLNNLAMRLNYYYIIFIPLLIPKIVASVSPKNKPIAILGQSVIVIFFALYFFAFFEKTNALHVCPYQFFWETEL